MIVMSQMQQLPCLLVDKSSNKLVQILRSPCLSKGIMALVLVGGLPDKFRIGSAWNNYMYKSMYASKFLL